MNKVIIGGYLGRDAEVRYTTSGKCVATFSVGVKRVGKDAGTDWINCVAWEKKAELIGNTFHKGSHIVLEGAIQTRSYDGNDGKKKYITEVIVHELEFDGKSKGDMGTEANAEEIPF